MKRLTLIITAILSSFFFFSCTNVSTESVDDGVGATEILIEEENHHNEHEAIVLDNGNKWKVVEPMLVYIRNMETSINNFEGLTSEDYTILAKIIDKNLIELTSNCTMEGQAHDELHKWLVPFIELSEQFDVATDLQEQEKIYEAFEASFVEFNTYFK